MKLSWFKPFIFFCPRESMLEGMNDVVMVKKVKYRVGNFTRN